MENPNFRYNPNWQALEVGEPVVSDHILSGKQRFVPFLFAPLAHGLADHGYEDLKR